ncbi:MAG: Na+/H+ antiporter NhaC family protein [Bacteroidales bacterium]|nr:Na+/H+ antiporter NhaC family protein [Bacteroidales bacterium]
MKKKWIGLALVLVLALGMALLYAFGPVVGPMPLWMSILPPLVAIVMALIIKEVISSLFVGILTGTFLMVLYGGASPASALGGGLLRVVDTYVVGSLFDADHVTIIVFTLIIGGMVRIITVNGGMQGVVNWLSRRAHGPRSGQLMTFLMDLCIFFDDYSNTLVVGNTMRPVTDKLKVSREKLAYIVDSTSAPVVAVAFVTTWIGAELSYIQDGISAIGLEASAYSVFFHSLAYSFYPFLTLGFVLMIIFSGRDFGPMLKAERKARNASAMEIEMTNGVSRPAHIIDALIPLTVLIFGTIIGLIATGYDASVWQAETGFFSELSATIGAANSYKALLWASVLSLLTAIVMTMLRGDMKFGKIMEEMVEGFKAMFNAVLILTLAWSIALVTKDMHTAEFVSQLLVQWSLSPTVVPVLTFLLAALIGFSTGTSWGTMAILYPLILPASWLLCQEQGLNVEATMPLFYNVVASVLAGSVMGDHCSPISDTTIMSSLASSCNHMQHVSTQMPYALTVGATALLMGVLPTALGLPSWVAFLTGFAVLWLVVRFVGKKV